MAKAKKTAETLEQDNAVTEQAAADDAAEQRAETLEQDNADTTEIKTVTGNVVYVFANLPNGQSFNLGKKTVTINGLTVDRLRTPDGSFAGGKYGVTVVAADDWFEVMRRYGKMRMFQSGLVFDAPTLERGEAMARERGGLRHGWEPADPEKALSRPKTDKD